MPRLCMGALIQMQTCFSQVAVTPEGHQTETPDGSQTYLLQIPYFLQGALERIEICHVWVLDGPATTPAFDRSIFVGLSVPRRM